jgi:hypothetical protein
MGKIGKRIGTLLGSTLGKIAGKHLEKYTGLGEDDGFAIGTKVGGHLGSFLPFKKGGPIKKNGPIYGHKGEFVLPPGIEPTDYQLKLVKKRGGLKAKQPVNVLGKPVKPMKKVMKKSKK